MKDARLTLTAVLTAALALAAAGVCATPDPADMVRKSQAADRSVSYRGLKYADISAGARTVRAHFKIVHHKPDRTRTEYFAPPELAGIITIERGSETYRFLPSQQKWQRNKWELSPQRLSLAFQNYRAIHKGRDVVAGRRAYIVELEPRKRGNPSETLWIDTEHYLVLKSELRNSSGVPISVSAFREIAFDPNDISESIFEPGPDTKRLGNPVPDLGFTVVRPKYVPRGYSFANVSTVRLDSGYAAHLMYTNGINTISIFERKRGPKGSSGSEPNFGKWAHVLRFSHGRITFTIIGDIDKRQLKKVADSLKS